MDQTSACFAAEEAPTERVTGLRAAAFVLSELYEIASMLGIVTADDSADDVERKLDAFAAELVSA